MLRRLLPPATSLGAALLAVCVNLVLTACTTPSPRLDAGPAPVAWQATDFRVITHTVDGVERTLYTFMLVLEETQGSGITLTQLDYTIYHPGFAVIPASERTAILWKLRPYGELRQFFYSSPCCFETRFGIQGRLAPAWHIFLTGTNDHGQPVRVVVDLSLPPQPPVLTQRKSDAPPRAALATTTPVPTVVGSAVPFATMRHTVLVHAMLNHQEPVTLLLDTGATRTLLTPDIARRLGISPEPDAPTSSMVTLGSQEGDLPLIRLASLAVEDTAVEDLQVGVFTALPHAPFIDGLLGGDFLKVVGGRQVRFPLVPIATLAMGEAVVKDLQVGILATFPGTRPVDGLLGGDFLEHFTLTLDYRAKRLQLTPALPDRPVD